MPLPMGFSMMTKIIREDIVSSLTGGFYLDYQQTHFVNITHLYLWILFFVSPLVFHLVCPESFLATGVYSIAITLVVSLIKLITWRLHRLLDLKEPVTETRDNQLLLTGLSQKDAEDNPVAHQHLLNDPDYEEVNTAFVQDIEERCRRIGQAGLAMAQLGDSLRIDQGSSLAFPKKTANEDNPFANSYTSTITEEKTRIEKEHPSFHEFDPVASTVVESLQQPASSHKSQKSYSDLIDKANNGVESIQSSDDNIDCSACHEREEITKAPKKAAGSGITYLPQSSHKILHRRSPLSRRMPVRRQLSSTSTLLYSTEPSNSVNSVITADMERCKRIISQLEAEVNRLPVRSDEPFVPSLKDLDVLKRPQPRSSLVSICGRSNSQRHHRTILSSQIQTARQQATHLPCSLFYRQTVVPTELTELSLADTILYWRRNFASSSSHSDYRTFRSQSFHQSNLPSGSRGRIDTEAVLNRHTGRRSHSLRHSHSIRSQLSTGCRHLPRRPGSALRLRSQQSVDYAFNSTRSNLLTFPDFVKPTSTGLPPLKTAVDLKDSSRELAADVGYQKRKTVILKVPSAESEFTSPALGGIDSPHQHSDATPDLRKSTNDLDEDGAPNVAHSQFTELANPVDDNFGNSEPECTSEKSVGTHSPRFARRTGLVRQYGIRRKFIIVPTHKGDSVLVSNRSEVVAHLSSTQPSIIEQTNASAISNEEQPSGSTSSAAATDPSVGKSVIVSTDHEPCTSSSNPATKSVDVLLAQLMGVPSLAAAGLTRQQCLSQLRGSLGNEDSENAELDILFALTAAATNADEANVGGKNPWDVSTYQSEWARISEGCQSAEERPTQQQDQQGPQSLSCVPTPGPSTTFVPRSPTVDPHTIIAERVSFSPADSNDVHLVRAAETQSSTQNRRSIPQTRPFVRPRPLIRATRTRIQPKQIYVVRPFPLLPITIRLCLDRLQLDALFDRSRSILEPIFSVVLSFLVGVAGLSVLQTGVYRDLSVLSVCFAIAGSHYSLIKSVQPDAASPQHGFNRVIVYSRAIFFCLLALTFILTIRFHDKSFSNTYGFQSSLFLSTGLRTNELSLIDRSWFLSESPLLPIRAIPFRLPDPPEPPVHHSSDQSLQISHSADSAPYSIQVKLFGSAWSLEKLAHIVYTVTYRLLVIFPVLFLVGLVPQIDTALTYMLEQLDIHIFGGSGAVSLWSVCFSISRTLTAIVVSLWFCLAAIETGDPYHYLFSVFWALQVSLCFLLSRLPSNTSLYATLFPCSVSGEQLGQQLRILVSELFDFSCFSRISHKSTVQTSSERSKRRCRPRWPWSKSRKSKVDVVGVTREPVVWWRAWLPLLSNMGVKSTSRLSEAQTMTTERLLRHPLQPVEDVPSAGALLPVSLASPFAARAYKSFSLNDLLKTGNGHLSDPSKAIPKGRITCLPTADSLPVVSMSSDRTVIIDSKDKYETQEPHASLYHPKITGNVQSKNPALSRTSSVPISESNPLNDVWSSVSHPGLSTSVACERIAQAPLSDPVEEPPGDHFGPDLPSPSKTNPPELLQQLRDTVADSDISPDSKQPGIPQSNTDPLPELIRVALTERLKNDLNCCLLWLLVISCLHASPLLMYATKKSIFSRVLLWTVILCGILLHYVSPNLRKSYPWLCLARPPVAPHAYGELIRWETGYYWFCWIERNFLIPLLTVLTVTQSVTTLIDKFGPRGAAALILLTSMKMLRNGFCAPSRVFITLFFTDLLFTFDFHRISETFPVNYFFVSFLVSKVIELVRKLHFVYIYTAPFRITCGSVFHAIAQIVFIPHAVFMLGNCVFSTILSSPLEPFLASAVFITSYVRPIKFWEVEHRTERMETTNMSLASQLRGTTEQQVMLNSNAIFYERLSRNLQLTLAGDIQLGRLGGLTVGHGDVFILSSDDLNLVIHIVEVGNGLVTFQLRGLEFVGTYCHDHETEALRRTSHNDDGFCCCNPGHYPGMLSLNAALRMRCMTWQFIYGTYCVEGYRMTSHNADTVVQLNDLRKILVTRFVQCIIYYVTKLPHLSERLTTLQPCLQSNNFFCESHLDLDPVFLRVIDEDYDERVNGVTRRRFVQVYQSWIRYCVEKLSLSDTIPFDAGSTLVTLCYALSIMGRRSMGGVQAANFDVGQVLRGIHDIFKGDIHVLTKDDWVLTDLELLQTVITPAMRIALKLYQDNFLWASELNHVSLYSKIVYTEKNFVICHETDPRWRFAVLNDAHNLFSIRLMGMDSDNVYRFIQLTKGKLNFSAVKINPECVRGLWAGQQREQIFVRNTNHERGSIQGAQHVLRNLVNSSCDPPIGYPIYVSPLLTSFAGTNPTYVKVAGPWFSFVAVFRWLRERLVRLLTCRLLPNWRIPPSNETGMELTTQRSHPPPFSSPDYTQIGDPTVQICVPGGTDSFDVSVEPWFPFSESADSMRHEKLRTSGSAQFTTLAALVHQQQYESDGAASSDLGVQRTSLPRCTRVRIINVSQILNDKLNKLSWPSEEWRGRCLTLSACLASVYAGLEGETIHKWTPSNPDSNARSFCHRTIRLVGFPGGPPLLEGHFVAIFEDGIVELSGNTEPADNSSTPVVIESDQKS